MAEKNKKPQSAKSWFKDIIIILVCAIALAVLIKTFLVDTRAIPTGSMVPTIEVGDKVILWRLAYAFDSQPQRGDIVVFSPPAELNEKSDLIKRVIGLPGDTLEIKDGYVYINGEQLTEGYLNEPPHYAYGPVTVPENSYFMMGDNRNNSIDSHAWLNPFITDDDIKGRAVCCYWPLSRIGGLND